MRRETGIRRHAGDGASRRPRSSTCLLTIALLLILSGGAIAAPAVAVPAAAAPGAVAPAVAVPSEGAGTNQGGGGTVSIGVMITPRDLCAGIRPPCKCADGTPTLPPGLVKKGGQTGTAGEPDRSTPGHGKPKPDWCGSTVAPNE